MLSVNNNKKKKKKKKKKAHKPGLKNQSSDTHLNSAKGNTLKLYKYVQLQKTVPSQGSKLNETINSRKT